MCEFDRLEYDIQLRAKALAAGGIVSMEVSLGNSEICGAIKGELAEWRN